MKHRIGLAVFMCIVISASAFAGEPEMEKRQGGRCSLEGAWFGWSGFGPWTATLTETSSKGGTHVVHWAGGNGEWFGLCAGSVRSEQGTGNFIRTGPRSFEFTTVNFSLDADGLPVCIWKNSGWGEVNLGCESGELFGSIELFAPDANPFADEPFYVFPAGEGNPFILMTIDPWVE